MNINKDMKPFCYDGDVLRVILDSDGEPWWVARDVCNALGISNVTAAIEFLDDDERSRYNLGRQGEVNIISESGLYGLIGKSKKEEAKPFQRWVRKEVLPAIRKTGSYTKPKSDFPNMMPDEKLKHSQKMSFPMAKLVESADKYLEGKAALKALNFFTGMPVDDLLAELDEKHFSSNFYDGDYRADTGVLRDLIIQWVKKHCELGGDYSERASVLYQAFCDWAEKNMALSQPVTMKAFGSIMGKKFARRKESHIYYQGVRLAENDL